MGTFGALAEFEEGVIANASARAAKVVSWDQVRKMGISDAVQSSLLHHLATGGVWPSKLREYEQ